LALIGSGIGLTFMKYTWGTKQIGKLILISIYIFLAFLTARTAIRASYVQYDNATEYLVYAHGTRGVKDIMQQVEEISNRTESGYSLAIAYDTSPPDTGVSWPFKWYLRDYTNLRPFDQPSNVLREVPIILVDQKNFTNIEPVVSDDYYRFDYLRIWWPNQDYFRVTWKDILSVLKTPKLLDSIFEIWLNRDYSKYSELTGRSGFTLTNWAPSDQIRMYIRKDIAASIWDYGIGATANQEITTDPYEKNQITLPADSSFGGFGQQNGQFDTPRGIAVAPDGSVYVADSRNHRIQHFSSTGTFINSWGSFADGSLAPAPLGTFNEPWDLAVSPDGKWIYVADTWNHRIQKFTSTGTAITMWGAPLYGPGDPLGFWGPRGITVDRNGNVIVSDTGNKRIVITDKNGLFLGQFGSAGMGPGQFDEPVGIAVDNVGKLYIADTWNQRIQVFTPDAKGITYTYASSWEISGWYGQSLDNKPYITTDSKGKIIITDPDLSRVIEFSNSGEYQFMLTGDEINPFKVVSGLSVDASSNIWVVDSGDNRVYRFKLPLK
jgi:DNA-binding beta-propeller fold protein YncE